MGGYYMPSTAVVRQNYAEFAFIQDGTPMSESLAEFDRWLADRDLGVATLARGEGWVEGRLEC